MLTTIKHYLAKHRWLNILLQLIAFLLVFLLVSYWTTRHAVRGEAPAFSASLTDPDQAVTLEHYRGKPLLLHFWASWCPICELQHDSIAALSRDYQVLTVASWSGDASAIKKYMQEHQLAFAVIPDDEGTLAQLFGVRGTPSSFILDKTGHIRFVEQGYTTETGLRLRLWWLQSR